MSSTPDVTSNGVGLRVSHQFGFGAIDAEAMVTRAQRWINVPEQRKETVYNSSVPGYETILYCCVASVIIHSIGLQPMVIQ